MSALAILLVTGCAPSSPAPADATRTNASEPWVYEGVETPDPELDTAQLTEDMQLLVNRLPDWNAAPLIASYAAAAANGDPSMNCPPQDSLDDATLGTNTWWYGTCNTPAGVRFNGVMTAWEWNGHPVEATQIVDLYDRLPSGYSYTGGGFSGRIDIFDTAGTFDFSCSCQGILGHGTDAAGGSIYFNYTRGPASWTGVEADGTWLEETDVLPTVWQVHEYTTTNRRIVSQALASGVGVRYRASEIFVDVQEPANAPGTCVEALVRVETRDQQTNEWFSLVTDPTRTSGCEVCLVADEADIGQGEPLACVDLSVLVRQDPTSW